MAGGSKRNAEHKGDDSRKKSRNDKGRAVWGRDAVNRRKRNEDSKQRRQELGEEGKPIWVVEYSKEEIENEERKPKKKAAILFGYSGSGFSGLQIATKERTIEGELFKACVLAGAVSKANADDVKKISLVRCARTDKGVHAAGNVISAKIIVEQDTVARVNDKLPPEIRIWGIMRAVGSFSAYQHVDSRIYEYLIPTHCFLPPHPKTYLGERLLQLAEEAGDMEGYRERQSEVLDFWPNAEETIRPVLERFEPEVREKAVDILLNGQIHHFKKTQKEIRRANKNTENAADPPSTTVEDDSTVPNAEDQTDPVMTEKIAEAVKSIKKAYRDVRLAYRIDEARLERVRAALQQFVGTHRYHNYTIKKKMSDPSSKRHIRSFVTADKPILIDGSEWLSLKVHGQSFMMNQIRKMVFMAASVVRCGTDLKRCLSDSFTSERMNIPKAPGLGLLLERPVFEMYNERMRNNTQTDYDAIDFEPFRTEMEEFKQREIYDHMYREEEREGVFYYLWSSIDSHRSSQLLYLSSMGLKAVDGNDRMIEKELDTVIIGEDDDDDTVEEEDS